MGRVIRSVLVAGLLAALVAYSVWRGLEFLAGFTLVLLICVIFGAETRRLFNLIVELLGATRRAKLGGIEVHIGEKGQEIEAWAKILMANLSSEEVSLLLAIFFSPKHRFQAIDSLKDRFRGLRSRGLLKHNEEWMSKSTEVWLTELGEKLCENLVHSIQLGTAGAGSPVNEDRT
jgi:hypothetical protein